MKKCLNISLAYAIAAMVGGVFYREFTKWNGFSGVTMLGKVHTHLFLLGMMVFLLVALFAANGKLNEQRQYRAFLIIYNIGVPLTIMMMVARGVTQVLEIPLGTGVSAAISGIAGVGHILVGAGLILLLLALKKSQRIRRKP